MKTRQSVKSIHAGDSVRSVFALGSASYKVGRNGPYWRLELCDATGRIAGNIWAPASTTYTEMPVGRMVEVNASATTYQGRMQLTISQVRELTTAEQDDLDLADFLAASPFPIGAMWDKLMALVDREFVYPPWRAFVTGVLDDPEIGPGFRTIPAAKSMHHAYAGGLLEHSLSVAEVALLLAGHYPFVDRQCLLAGALFHDLGKVWEFSGGITNDYTDAGRLVGHMELALERLAPHWRQAGLHPELVQHLRHLILSHHGTYEFGSARLPQTAEAFLLHFADNIDAKMFQCHSMFEHWEEGRSRWSEGQKMLDRQMYNPYRTPVVDIVEAASGVGTADAATTAMQNAGESAPWEEIPPATVAAAVRDAVSPQPAHAVSSPAPEDTDSRFQEGLPLEPEDAGAAGDAEAPSCAAQADDTPAASTGERDCAYSEDDVFFDDAPRYDALDFPDEEPVPADDDIFMDTLFGEDAVASPSLPDSADATPVMDAPPALPADAPATHTDVTVHVAQSAPLRTETPQAEAEQTETTPDPAPVVMSLLTAPTAASTSVADGADGESGAAGAAGGRSAADSPRTSRKKPQEDLCLSLLKV